jgi:phosphoenolpyruvate-protein kinase (PTS system EI component)
VSTTLRGVPAAPGAGAGPAWRAVPPRDRVPGSLAEERELVGEALRLAGAQLDGRADALEADGRADEAEILRTNALIAADPGLADAALALLADGGRAEDALLAGAEEQAALLASLDDEMLALRADDVRAVGRRAAALASGHDPEPPAGAVLVAEDVGPGDVADAAGRVVAIVLGGGGPTAHAAIVARSLGVPLVTGVGSSLEAVSVGATLAVDANQGLVVSDPDEATRETVARQARAFAEARDRDQAERDLPTETRDGVALTLLANVGTPAEVEAALRAGAAGVGLLRTELELLKVEAWPTEEEHRRVLAPMLGPLSGRIVTVRLLDYGGDKLPPFLLEAGVDPWLAPRGIHLLFGEPEALSAQLRGLLAVAADAQLRILVPMVRDAADLDRVRALAEEARTAVAADGPPVRVGAMIEVPSAALLAPRVAAAADFLSVGTNDLVQYTLAAARLDARTGAVAHHPAVLQLIGLAASAAAERGIPIEVCGEAAGDPIAMPLLIGLGVGELSVSPNRIGPARRLLRTIDAAAARQAAAEAVRAATVAEVEAIVAGLGLGGER